VALLLVHCATMLRAAATRTGTGTGGTGTGVDEANTDDRGGARGLMVGAGMQGDDHAARVGSGRNSGGGRGRGGGGMAARLYLGSLVNLSQWRGALRDIRPPRHSVPLACLESDFMAHHRELSMRAAAAALVVCEATSVAESATLAARLHSDIANAQLGLRTGKRQQRLAKDVASAGNPCAATAASRAGLVSVALHPSGFFSVLHGLVKPLMFSLRTRRVLLTPRVPEYTSDKFAASPCPQRDLTCFFEPLSPSCDALEQEAGTQKSENGKKGAGRKWSLLARGGSRYNARDAVFVDGEAQRAQRVPTSYKSRGWFWWSSHLLSYLLRPNAALSAAVEEGLTSTGLRAAIDAGRLVIGVHVRHGDACRVEELVRARRTCTPLAEYMRAASRVLDLGSHGRRGGRKPLLYLATDSMQVVRESAAYADRFEVVSLDEKKGTMRHEPKSGDALLWDKRVWQRFFWGQTDWTQQAAWTATVEMLLLGHADVLIGKFSSNLFRAAYALRAAQCDCAPLFSSLDAPTCFDYGVRSGRNWEFPVLNASVRERERTDATFQC
jgi:hypothetical protein